MMSADPDRSLARRRRCRGNLRPAPFGITPAIVRGVLELAHRAPALTLVPVLPIKLVDRPRGSTVRQDRTVENDEITQFTTEHDSPVNDDQVETPPAVTDGGDVPARVAPAEVPAPVLQSAELDPAGLEDWPDAPLPDHADPDLDRADTALPDMPEGVLADIRALQEEQLKIAEGHAQAFARDVAKASAARRSDGFHRGAARRAARDLEAPLDQRVAAATRLDMIRRAAAALSPGAALRGPDAAQSRPVPGLRQPKAALVMPPLPPMQRRAALEAATAFLKRHGLLVSVSDRHAPVRKYRVSGKAAAMFAEDVIEIARELGHDLANDVGRDTALRA